jgi:hypothetical protein
MALYVSDLGKRVPATGDFLGFPIAFYIDDAKGMPDYLAAA